MCKLHFLSQQHWDQTLDVLCLCQPMVMNILVTPPRKTRLLSQFASNSLSGNCDKAHSLEVTC